LAGFSSEIQRGFDSTKPKLRKTFNHDITRPIFSGKSLSDGFTASTAVHLRSGLASTPSEYGCRATGFL
jgi:hypothetical protein